MITKNKVNEFITLVKNYGYWSEQVKEFLLKYDYYNAIKLHHKATKQLNFDITKL